MSVQNSIRLVGRLTKDPEIRTFEKDGQTQKVASFSIAVDRYSKNEHYAADFFDCTAFRQRAEFIEKFFHKGDRIIVEGEGHFDTYQDKDGNNRKAFKVSVSDCTFGSAKPDPASTQAPAAKPAAKPVNVAADTDADGDLPW